MAKAKAGKKVPPKKSKKVEAAAEDSGSDIEVLEEIERDGTGSDNSYKRGGSRGRKPKGGGKATPARSSKRDAKSKSYKEQVESEVSSEEDKEEEKPAKKKKAVKKVIELAFSKSEGTTEESDEANDKDGKEEEQLPEINDVEDDEAADEKKTSKAGTSGKRGKGRPAKTSAPAKKPKKAESKVDKEEEGEEEEDVDPDAEYEVERILEVKLMKSGKREFLVKWKGFSLNETTWEPEENLQHAKDLLDIFLTKVDKNDLSRTRRLSTIQSTKSSYGQSETRSSSSSSAPLTRTREGRVSKSRSRTPRIGSTTSSSTSSAPKPDKLISVKEDEESDEARPLPKLRSNGDLTLQKFMRESVERKLELLKDKHKPSAGSTILETKEELTGTNLKPNQSPATRSKFGRVARTVIACGVAVSVGAAALVFTNPETLNWDQISPQLQQAIENVRSTYDQAFSKLQNHAPI